MKAQKTTSNNDPSTEEKIKTAARTIFYKKGFAATRTRDIALEAGINLALLNYYFRSKEKLFNIIMQESLQGFFQSIAPVFNNKESSWEQKIEGFVSEYIDFLLEHPNLPLFILSELQSNPDVFASKMNMKELIMKSHFVKQFKQEVKKGEIVAVDPIQLFMNLTGLVVFPFIASPIFKNMGNLSHANFNALIHERKRLIPQWIKAMHKRE